MAEQPWDERAVFLAARELAGSALDAFLDQACRTPDQRARIEVLLAHDKRIDEKFLEPSAGDEARAPRQIDEFTILRRLGQGGMGTVYLAYDTVLERQVAVKVLATHLLGSTHALRRFHTEARIAANLNHPAIIPIFRFGQADCGAFLVSEYVPGPTLAEHIEARRSARPGGVDRTWVETITRLAARIAEALEFAHQAGVVHRDVKPSNIILDPRNGPRLGDFGIAKDTRDADDTQTSGHLGTYYYMSPEQATLNTIAIDRRSDVFSLGVVLYEALALKRPFEGDTVPAVLHALTSKEPPALRRVHPAIPRDLSVVCQRTLEKDPAQRYQSAAHVAADLRSVLAGDPILARPPSLTRRGVRWGRRHRITILGVALLGTLAVIGLLAWREQVRRGEQQAWVSVDGPRTATLFVQRYDSVTLRPGLPESGGRLPLRKRGLPAGRYRFTFRADDGGLLGETDLSLRAVGRAAHRRVQFGAYADDEVVGVPPVQTDVAAMIAVAGGSYPVALPGIDGDTTVVLSGFLIDRFEVSNRQYKTFIEQTGRSVPFHWAEYGYPTEHDDLPVVGLTFAEMEAYARWRGARLPTPAEWQAAVRGPAGLNQPPIQPDRAEVNARFAEYVDASQIGKLERAWELTLRRTVPVTTDDPYGATLPHAFGNVREMTSAANDSHAVLMGRAWMDPPDTRFSQTVLFPVDRKSLVHGFRCARSAAAPQRTGD